MPEYAPGTPSWVDLSSPNPEASAAFYGEVMGWMATEPGPAEETGGYRMFQQDGQNVGGLMGHMQEGQPTVWSTYMSVTDADETAAKVKAAGAVFDWVGDRPWFEGAPESYAVWKLAERPVGGLMQMTDDSFPPEVPPHWSVCFAVADCDSTVAKARALGATITAGPMDTPIGRFAGLIDPHGASFSVIQAAPAGSSGMAIP